MLIEIDRLHVVLHGVSALVAEQAADGLDAALRRRLGALRGGFAGRAVPELRVGPLDLPPGIDAAALRDLIAERLIDAVLKPTSAEERD